MPYPAFDRSKLKLQPLETRQHDLHLDHLLFLDDHKTSFHHPSLGKLCNRIQKAKAHERPIILMMGAHVIRAGVSRFIIEMMQRGWITHLAMNGAGPIHDWELALIGSTTESVARYVRSGEFGLWHETGQLNDIIKNGIQQEMGIGESIGQAIESSTFPHKDVSLLAAAYRLGIPATVHIGIGYDIIHEHPNCDGAALGQASYRDFLVFTQNISRMEGGVLLNFGTSVMGPEVYLKALTMARNVAHATGQKIQHFTTAVFDLLPLDGDLTSEAPKNDPKYYFRPWKTILVRTVADGGESFYFQGDHRTTIPALYQKLLSCVATDCE